jgi:hypothetical protein
VTEGLGSHAEEGTVVLGVLMFFADADSEVRFGMR